jgi:glycosyltransferase involved in cell wall biosynthesis
MAKKANAPISKACIYCDCNSHAGVFSYTLRMLDMFHSWGWATRLLSHEPRTDAERAASAILSAKADSTLLIPHELTPERQIKRMETFLRLEQPQVFVPNYRKLPWDAAARLSRDLPLRIVGVCHSDHESYYEGSIKRYIEQISVCVCPSRKTQQELVKRLPAQYHRKLAYIPHYIQMQSEQRARFKTSPFTVIYHGRLREEQKRVSEILKVAAMVCKTDPNIHFKLIGDNQETGLYERLIQEHDLEHHCTLVAPMSWDALQGELVQAQAAILTSEYEGFCYTAAEALSAGLPVVAYNCGDVITDFVQSGINGFIEPWGHADALAQRILFLAADADSWSRCSRNALTTAQEIFGFDVASARYRRALEDHPVPRHPWPRLRPTYIPATGRSLRSFIDRMGHRLGAW